MSELGGVNGGWRGGRVGGGVEWGGDGDCITPPLRVEIEILMLEAVGGGLCRGGVAAGGQLLLEGKGAVEL